MNPPDSLEFDDDDVPAKPAAKPGPGVPAKPPTTAVAKPGTAGIAKPAAAGLAKPAAAGLGKPAPAGLGKPATAGLAKPGISKPAPAGLKPEAEKPAIGESAAAANPLADAGQVNYSFEDSEEPPKPKRPVMPMDTSAPPPVEDPPAAETPAKPAPKPTAKPAGKPATSQITKAPAPASAPKPAPAVPDRPVLATPDPTGGDDQDPDLKPGSRKDLWKCPHCGTGNRPGREDCRKCGKRPDDEVETPWINKPQSWAIIGVVGLVVVLLIFVLLRSDISLHPADGGHVDSAVRVGGKPASGVSMIDGKNFTPSRQLSVVGRCLDSQPSNDVQGLTTLVLLLGSDARSDDALQVKVTFNNQRTEVPDGALKHFAVFHIFPGDGVDKPVLTKGAYVSFVGDLGEIDGFSGGFEEYTVRIRQFQSGP